MFTSKLLAGFEAIFFFTREPESVSINNILNRTLSEERRSSSRHYPSVLFQLFQKVLSESVFFNQKGKFWVHFTFIAAFSVLSLT